MLNQLDHSSLVMGRRQTPTPDLASSTTNNLSPPTTTTIDNNPSTTPPRHHHRQWPLPAVTITAQHHHATSPTMPNERTPAAHTNDTTTPRHQSQHTDEPLTAQSRVAVMMWHINGTHWTCMSDSGDAHRRHRPQQPPPRQQRTMAGT
ncbi:hypothetical protein K443DRAFT_10973 [Laccaria amethystina LaAM-08-1]|uniref:Uncharacterized protein n=1 Tax=Laccaria amethystina LaAM-08-1 TaxID=1095629 RepID=A0A0C9WUN8_9AGAR|nr:hypothetical protein K443DRAFT_10973 [Laccaria amethystina LaAM-08-1]